MPTWEGPGEADVDDDGGSNRRQGDLRQLTKLRKCQATNNGGSIIDLWLTEGSYNGPAKGYQGKYGDEVLRNRALLVINNHGRDQSHGRGRDAATKAFLNATATDRTTTASAPLFLFIATAGLHMPVKAPPNYDKRAPTPFGRMTVFADDTLGALRQVSGHARVNI